MTSSGVIVARPSLQSRTVAGQPFEHALDRRPLVARHHPPRAAALEPGSVLRVEDRVEQRERPPAGGHGGEGSLLASTDGHHGRSHEPAEAPMSPRRRNARPPGPTTSGSGPGPLVGVDWLAAHLDDPDVRLVHVSPDRRVYNKRHVPGATYSDLHKELALKGTAPETGDAEREWLVPTAERVADGPASMAGRRGRPDRLLRRRRAQPAGHPRLLAHAALPVPEGPAAHPRRRHRSLATGRSADDDRRARAGPRRRAAPAGRARRARRLAHRDLRGGPRLEPRGLDGSRRPDPHPRRPDRGRVRRHGSASPPWRPHPGGPAAAASRTC